MARKFESKSLVLNNPQRIERKQALAESDPEFVTTGHELVLNILRQAKAGNPIPAEVIRNVIERNFKRALHNAGRQVTHR